MTCKEIGEYVEQQERKSKDSFMQASIIQYRGGQQIISVMGAKHPKALKFDELFPEFNNENNTSKEEAIENKWREFLGVIK